MPANQSSPSAPKGARPDPSATANTRPGSSAPHASAYGPPPEWPRTANSPTPSASATAAASAAAEALSRSGRAVELMYPGPVVGDPADAPLGRRREQRLGRWAGVRRA